jgi:hypothetical protein
MIEVADEGKTKQEGRLVLGAGGRIWRAVVNRWPWRLTVQRPRLSRWRLAALAGVGILLAMWAAIVVSSITIYSAQVLVTDGAAIGIPPPDERLDFGDVPRADRVERGITFTNHGRIPTAVMILEWGGIRDLLHVSDAFFTLDPGEERKIRFHVQPPASAETTKYSGKVIVVRAPWWWPW